VIDLHTHIMAGVDDGPADEDTSLVLAAALERLGFTRVFLTPHWPAFPGAGKDAGEQTRTLAVRMSAFAVRAAAVVPHIRFLAGAEYPLDEMLGEWAADRPGGGRFVLVDACFAVLPRDPGRMIRPLREAGLFTLLVHPERSPDLRAGSPALSSFVAEGAALVGNLGSLGGLYRRETRDAARELLRRGLYWAFASDLHHPGQLPAVEKGLEELSRLAGPDFPSLLEHNPRLVAEGQETLP
jgi:protein-tyrosine phosphatase